MPARAAARTKRLRGTARADRVRRQLNHAPVLAAVPPPPEGLSERAAATWVRLGRLSIAAGVLTELDVELLELAARTVANVAELEEILAREGLTTDAGSGGKKAHPACAMLDRARAHAHRFLTDLGLTPPARERLSIEPIGGDNPFSRLAL